MPSSKRRKRSSTVESSHQHLQEPPSVTLPSPIDSRHAHSPVIDEYTRTMPTLSYAHVHPYYHISGTSPMENASAPQPSQSLTAASATGPTTKTATPRYERISPKQLSNTSSFGQLPLSLSFIHAANATLPSATTARNLHVLTPSPLPSAVDQREQERRKSHRAIERRRRDRINDKIMQLKRIIPACANQDNLHKLSILQSTIDYIHYLKNLVDEEEQQQPLSQPTIHATEISPPPPPPSDDDRTYSPLPAMDPLVPASRTRHNHSPSPGSTHPPTPSYYSLSLGKNNHMKVDNLIS